MEYNISEAELPTMVVRYENKLILRSVITGQHLEDLGYAPIWDEVPVTPTLQARRQRIKSEHDVALEALVRLYPCDELVPLQTPQPQPIQQCIPKQSPQKRAMPIITTRAPSPLPVTEIELPPCKVHRNYCCNYCNFCTQNPRSHLLHQRQVHGIRLSIHCCHHCQYASRYFQKLKRHVKMVHMSNSPGKSKIRNKSAVRRATKPKVLQSTNIVHSNKVELTNSVSAMLIQTPEPAKATTQLSQKPSLLPQLAADSFDMQSTMSPAVFKNPEAFFEAAYRNQLIQQQLQEQRFKEFVKLSNQLNIVNQSEAAKVPTATTTTNPNMSSTNPVQAIQNKSKVKPMLPSNSPTLPTVSMLSHNQLDAATPEIERKRIYGCRKCSYVTHIKSRYNKHVKYHSMPMIQCDKCEFRTTYKWNLTRHLRSHHGNGLYKCSVCSFSAHMKQSLTSHELNHHSPPVGHISRVHNKPFRRRRCRVGGSDLVQDMRTNMGNSKVCHGQPNIVTRPNSEPITADNLSNFSSTVDHECLKLVIKREAGTSSYSSTQTSKSTHTTASYVNELCSTSMAMALNPKSASSTNSYSSSYTSTSPISTSSNVSVVDHGSTLENFELPVVKPKNIQENASLNSSTLEEIFPTAETQQRQVLDLPNPQQQALENLNVEAQNFPYSPPQIMEHASALSTAQTTFYTTSEDSDPDSEDSDDTYSTVSANETVPPGLHIAYESSSPDRKSTSSESSTTSQISLKLQSTSELSPHSGFTDNATNVATLEN